jgi:hypothetical protein
MAELSTTLGVMDLWWLLEINTVDALNRAAVREYEEQMAK